MPERIVRTVLLVSAVLAGLIGGVQGVACSTQREQLDAAARLRSQGSHEQAIEVLRAVIATQSSDEPILRRAYNELVFTFLDTNSPESEEAAHEALRRYPDLSADPTRFPPSINELYENLRRELFGSLLLDTRPPQAWVTIGELYDGESPVEIAYVPVGEYAVRIQQAKHLDKSTTIRVDPGRETSMTVTLDRVSPFAHRGRYRFGVDIGLNRVHADFKGYNHLSAATWKFSGGVQMDIGFKPWLYTQTGVRYVQLGNGTADEELWFLPGSDVTFHYVAVPVLAKAFPVDALGLFVTLGPELSIFLHGDQGGSIATDSEGNIIAEWDDINMDRLNLAVNMGVGYEVTSTLASPFVYVQYSLGVTRSSMIDIEQPVMSTRELKLSLGVYF
jgi:hypothetical protein